MLMVRLVLRRGSLTGRTTRNRRSPNKGYVTLNGRPQLYGSSMWHWIEKGQCVTVCTRGHIPSEMTPRQKGQLWGTTAGVTLVRIGP